MGSHKSRCTGIHTSLEGSQFDFLHTFFIATANIQHIMSISRRITTAGKVFNSCSDACILISPDSSIDEF